MAALANRRSYTFDATMQLKDAGLVAASGAAQVNSSNQILDVGASPFMGVAVIDVSAIEVDSSNEEYDIIIEGSNSASFASGNCALACMPLGHATALGAGLTAQGVGHFELPFINCQNDQVFRYIRAYTRVAGTIVTGINWKGFVGRVPDGF